MTWPEAGALPPGSVLAVPLGSTEQHGPHLPLSTDTDVASALCGALAAARPDVVVAPALPYGASGEHGGFAGTLSIGTAALTTVLVELGRSASATFTRLLIVSGHGGNAEAVAAAVSLLRRESRDVLAWFPRWKGDPHAGYVETSLQLTLTPSAVDLSRAEKGATDPLPTLMPALRAGGVRAVSPNGVLGDPSGASASEGRRLLAELTADLLTTVAAWTGPPTATDPRAASAAGPEPRPDARPFRGAAAPAATGPRGAVGPSGTVRGDGAAGPRGAVGPAGTVRGDGAAGPRGAVGTVGAARRGGAVGPHGARGTAGPSDGAGERR